MTGAERERETGGPALALDPRTRRKGPTARTATATTAAQRTTQQGAQQPAGTKNLRETSNAELREENPKSSPENFINTFCGAP